MEPFERDICIALSLCPGLERSTLRKLVQACGGPMGAWEASVTEWSKGCHLHQDTAEQLDKWRRTFQPHLVSRYTADLGVYCEVFGDVGYPSGLLDLHDPPLVLFSSRAFDTSWFEKTVSIVGTRRASGYALEATTWVSETLADNGFNVVSGLALGVDGAAHSGALKVGGKTTAVLASGIDVCYPPHHRSLHNDILQRGMLLSENAPGTCVAKWRFPERNRIIAALAPTLIIVQAGDKSGALRTVDFALEIGRDVFVVPGPVTSMHFRGSNRLIQQGSQVLLDPHDLLETLSGLPTSARLSTVPARWQDLYDAIQEASVAAALVTQLGKSPSHIYAGLLELELAGLIIKRPGGLYERGGS